MMCSALLLLFCNSTSLCCIGSVCYYTYTRVHVDDACVGWMAFALGTSPTRINVLYLQSFAASGHDISSHYLFMSSLSCIETLSCSHSPVYLVNAVSSPVVSPILCFPHLCIMPFCLLCSAWHCSRSPMAFLCGCHLADQDAQTDRGCTTSASQQE